MAQIVSTGRTGFYIVKETDCGKQFWSAKHGDWVGRGYGTWRLRSRFRSIEAASLELKRIRLSLTPEYPKSKLRKIKETP